MIGMRSSSEARLWAPWEKLLVRIPAARLLVANRNDTQQCPSRRFFAARVDRFSKNNGRTQELAGRQGVPQAVFANANGIRHFAANAARGKDFGALPLFAIVCIRSPLFAAVGNRVTPKMTPNANVSGGFSMRSPPRTFRAFQTLVTPVATKFADRLESLELVRAKGRRETLGSFRDERGRGETRRARIAGLRLDFLSAGPVRTAGDARRWTNGRSRSPHRAGRA